MPESLDDLRAKPASNASGTSGGTSEVGLATFRSGFATLLGLPNVGKSTLLNACVGERLSIVSPKAQTTQRKLLGICSGPDGQAVFIDTPGLLRPRFALHRSMREDALSALEDADVAVAVVDAASRRSIEWAESFAFPSAVPRILCLNKVDLVSARRGRELAGRLDACGKWAAVRMASAVKGSGIDGLRASVISQLPESPPLYPVDELSSAPVRDFAAERIREACFELLSAEVPHAVAVRIEEFKERGDGKPVYIRAVLYVQRESQKGIVIGSGGRTIREIGVRGRAKIEAFLGRSAYLDLRVKVLQSWHKKRRFLKLLGFRLPNRQP